MESITADNQYQLTETDPQAVVLRHLGLAAAYPHPVAEVRHIQTHISHVFLTGDFVYKIKKAVKFDFLDFSSLEKRKHYCEEELRLNTRYAPDLYLDLVPISKTTDQSGAVKLEFGTAGEVIEYAVRMNQFETTFDHLALDNHLARELLVEITEVISQFHSTARPRLGYWQADEVASLIKSNLAGCAEFCPTVLGQNSFEVLTQRTESELLRRRTLLGRRQSTHVRELHGDLHLRNMCVYRGRAELFDGIEFNPHLSNCDVWADFSFLIMDLFHRGLRSEAALVWNRYLQNTDDFEGVQLLDLYAAYRAAVRCRIACLALPSADADSRIELAAEANQYAILASRFLGSRQQAVIAVGGLAGSGKSTLASNLAQRVLAVQIRSDAVRKHIAGVPLSMQAPQDAYSEEMNRQTLAGMVERGCHVLESGRPLVFDAVFHSPIWRKEVEQLAKRYRVPFIGFWCEVPTAVARERIRQRNGDISDADESVIELQHSYQLGEIDWIRIDTDRGKQQSLTLALNSSAGCRQLEQSAASLFGAAEPSDQYGIGA